MPPLPARSVLGKALIVLLFGCTTYGEDTQFLQLAKTLPLGDVKGRIDHMAFDGKHLFVAALGNDSVVVVDTEGGVVAGGVGGEVKKPQGVCYLADSKMLAVTSGGDGRCLLFDNALLLVGMVRSLDDADNVRYDPNDRKLYVGYGDGALAVIDPVKASKVGEIKLDAHPESFQLESTGRRIFVNVPGAGHVAVVDRDKGAVVAKWEVREAKANFPMALDEANHRMFVGCRRPDKLLALDTDSGKVVASLDCCGDADDVFYDAEKARIYLSGGEGCVSVFAQRDADTYRPLGRQKTAPGARTCLFVPESHTLFVAVPAKAGQTAEVRVLKVP